MEAPITTLTPEAHRHEPTTLVWIDAREAFVVRWQNGETSVERLESEVPAHHKSTGHVGHDPMIRHGGGGRQQSAGEPHRLEHLARFVEQVASKLPGEDDVTIIGPGTVREHLERAVREDDEHHHRSRGVTVAASRRLTERQLLARVRALAGDLPKRRTVGAYRWTRETPMRTSGAALPAPGKVLKKPVERIRVEETIADAALAEELESIAEEEPPAIEGGPAAPGGATR